MKKVLVFVFGLVLVGTAFAAGENIPTSQSFVDSAIAQKQDNIPANNGAAQVLTNTGSLGSIGTKNIYDETGAYSTQTDSLVTAGAFNTAVQNAIDAEFVCVSWVNDDPNDECLLLEIRGATESQSRNLFDSSQLLAASGWTENNGVYTGHAGTLYRLGAINACGTECKPNTQYTLSYTITNDTNNPAHRPRFYIVHTDGTDIAQSAAEMLNADMPGETQHVVLTSAANKTVSDIRFTYGNNGIVHIKNVQFEEGTSPTPYQPYGQNIYMPVGD